MIVKAGSDFQGHPGYLEMGMRQAAISAFSLSHGRDLAGNPAAAPGIVERGVFLA